MGMLLGEVGQMVARWGHFMAGVAWIGILYYFNFVQGAFFNEIDAKTKNEAIAKLVPRALWWFRWGAMGTWLTGLYILAAKAHVGGGFEIYATSWGINILVGALLGTLMFLNVWLIIWPNQKVVIQSATQVLAGGAPIADAAACGAKAGLASRHNTLFSIPLLLFMGMASHLGYTVSAESLLPLWGAIIAIVGAIEFNAIKGKMGPIATVKGVITCGLALAVLLFAVVRVLS
jgi:uncharacterized membrane protein